MGHSEFEGERDRGDDAKERGLLSNGARGRIGIILEADHERIVTAVGIVDAKRTDACIVRRPLRPSGTEVKAVIGWRTIAIALSIIVIGGAIDLIFRTGSRQGLSRVVAPRA